MLPHFLQSLNSKATSKSKAQANFDPSEFIPFAGALSPHTLITKNGDILTMLRIESAASGLINEADDGTPLLRTQIRECLKRQIDDDRISLWIHTSRTRSEIPATPPASHPLLKALDAHWQQNARFTHTYRNVVTLTILMQGHSTKLFDLKEFKQSRSQSANRRFRSAEIEEAMASLESYVNAIATDLSEHFQVRRLGMVEAADAKNQPVYISEPLSFLSTLTSLREQPLPLVDEDMSKQLYTHELIFGYNALESRGTGGKRFGAVFSLKHYHELPATTLDALLQLPYEITVAEAIDFVPAAQATAPHRALADIYKISQDPTIAKASGVMGMLEAYTGSPADYANHQISMLLAADDFASVEAGAAALQQAAARIGLVLIREDIRMEECFWSLLPGNFAFLRRQYPTHTRHLAGCARLNMFPVGEAKSRWGAPIAVFPTHTHTPYLFHFHHGDSGHTCLLDYNSFPDNIGTRTLNLLIAKTLSAGHRVMAIEQTARHGALAEALGGTRLRIGHANGASLNPAALEDSARNRGFLVAWVGFVLGVDTEDAAIRTILKTAVDQWFSHGGSVRTLADLAEAITQAGGSALGSQLRSLISHPAYTKVYTEHGSAIDTSSPLTVVSLHTQDVNSMACASAFALVLHQWIHTLDGTPTLLVLSDGFALCNNGFIAPRLQSLLAMLDQQNVAVVFATAQPEASAESSVADTITQACATKIILSDDVPTPLYEQRFGLHPNTAKELARQDRQKGEGVIQHGHEVIPMYIPTDWPEPLLNVLEHHSSQSG